MNLLKLLGWFVETLIEKCDAETARSVADSVLDKVEDYFKGTKNKYDDLLLPAIKKCIREPFGIPDNDGSENSGEDQEPQEE